MQLISMLIFFLTYMCCNRLKYINIELMKQKSKDKSNKQGHIAKYCNYDILCKHCGECGRRQRDCPAHKEETARKEYGDYFHAIIEGRNTRDNSSLEGRNRT